MSSCPLNFGPYRYLPPTSILTLEWENRLSYGFSSDTLSQFETPVVAVLDKLKGRRHLQKSQETFEQLDYHLNIHFQCSTGNFP